MSTHDARPCAACGLITTIPPPRDSDLSPERLNHLFSTNDEPEDAELAPLRRHFAGVDSDIDVLDRQILHLQRHLGELEKQRKCRELIGKNLRSALGRYRCISANTWRQIFTYAVDPGQVERFVRYAKTYIGPHTWKPVPVDRTVWYITSVCAAWRATATAEAHLWATIVVDFKTKSSAQLLRAHLQLERANTQDLTIYITPNRSLTEKKKGTDRSYDHFLASSPRWKVLLFARPPAAYDPFMSRTFKLPKLSTVGFNGMFREHPSANTQLKTFLLSAPLVEFIGDGLNRPILGDTVTTWCQPATLEYDGRGSHFNETLVRLPFLKRCEVYGSSVSFLQPVTSATLQSLTYIDAVGIKGSRENAAETLFIQATLPSLRAFHVTTRADTLAQMPTFLDRCGLGLTTLSLDIRASGWQRAKFDGDVLTAALQKAPLLRCLILDTTDNHDHNPSLLKALALSTTSGRPALVPLLEVLWLQKSAFQMALDRETGLPVPDEAHWQSFRSDIHQIRPNLRVETEVITLGLSSEYDTRAADKGLAMDYFTPL